MQRAAITSLRKRINFIGKNLSGDLGGRPQAKPVTELISSVEDREEFRSVAASAGGAKHLMARQKPLFGRQPHEDHPTPDCLSSPAARFPSPWLPTRSLVAEPQRPSISPAARRVAARVPAPERSQSRGGHPAPRYRPSRGAQSATRAGLNRISRVRAHRGGWAPRRGLALRALWSSLYVHRRSRRPVCPW
jgi:hypothetical protein